MVSSRLWNAAWPSAGDAAWTTTASAAVAPQLPIETAPTFACSLTPHRAALWTASPDQTCGPAELFRGYRLGPKPGIRLVHDLFVELLHQAILVVQLRRARSSVALAHPPIDFRRGRLPPMVGDRWPLIECQLWSGAMGRQLIVSARLRVGRTTEPQ